VDYVFEWNPDKARRNKKQHGISFEQAIMVFKDPKAISIYDTEHSKGEDRWITLGLSVNHGLVVVCHTFQWISKSVARIRIFSSRKATRRERQQYSE
jgi:uncharacterized DUF497 family protein